MLLSDSPDLTDRDRLAWAFGELRERGWRAPYTWGTQMCCANCGWHEILSELDDPEDLFEGRVPTLFWHTRVDIVAFCGTDSAAEILPPELQEQIKRAADLSAEDEARWHHEHEHELRLADVMARTTAYQQLREDLYLQWAGSMDDAEVAVAVLRSAGLLVTEPPDDSEAIIVHPKVRKIDVAPATGDGVLIRVGMHELVLSLEDAFTLTESLDLHIRHVQ